MHARASYNATGRALVIVPQVCTQMALHIGHVLQRAPGRLQLGVAQVQGGVPRLKLGAAGWQVGHSASVLLLMLHLLLQNNTGFGQQAIRLFL